MTKLLMISIFIMSTSFAGTGCRKGATKYSCESTKGAKREYLCSKNPKLEKEKITKRCLIKRKKMKKTIKKVKKVNKVKK